MVEPHGQLLRRPSIIDQHLANLLHSVSIDVEAGTELLADGGVLHRLTELLATERCERAAEILAEMAKSEDNRIAFIQQEVIPPLVALIHTAGPTALRQACRAMGNMCFESSTGRQIVLNEGGLSALIRRLDEFRPTSPTTPEQDNVHYMLCGALHTVCMDHEDVQKEVIRLQILPILIDYMKYSGECVVLRFCLNIVSTIMDHVEQVDEAVSLNLPFIVTDILKQQADDEEVKEAALDLIVHYNLIERPIVQMQLYHAGLISQLLDVMNWSHDDAECQKDAIEKIAAEILVFMLSHDGIAQLVLEDHSLKIVDEALHWMKGYHEHLRGTGALVIGNLATSDLRSAELSQHAEIIPTLFKTLLADYCSEEMSIKVKHAVLSAIKNLTICKSAKPLIAPYMSDLKSYVMQGDKPMLVYKSLGCIRCLCRGNPELCAELSGQVELIQYLTELPNNNKYHAGIVGEVPRLLCTLVVEGTADTNKLSTLVQCGVTPLILEMSARLEQPQMQVEAWLAIQSIISKGGDAERLVAEGLLKHCTVCLGEGVNPNVRILVLDVLRSVSNQISPSDDVQEICNRLNSLAVSEDVPAKKLAQEIKQLKPFV